MYLTMVLRYCVNQLGETLYQCQFTENHAFLCVINSTLTVLYFHGGTPCFVNEIPCVMHYLVPYAKRVCMRLGYISMRCVFYILL